MSLHVSLYGIINSSATSNTLDRLLNRLVGVCGGVDLFATDEKGQWCSNYMQHVIVYVPATKVGRDLVQVRLHSTCQDDGKTVELKERLWRLGTFGHPDPAIKACIVRSVVDVPFKGDVFQYLDLMGFEYKFEYCRKGYWFNYAGLLTVFVHQIYKVDEKFNVNHIHVMDPGRWLVEVVSLPVPQTMVADTQILLGTFATYLTGLVELKPVDPLILKHVIT